MYNKNIGIEKFFGLIIIFIALLLIPTILFGGETDIRPENISESQGKYVLIVKGDLISLKAKDASLKGVLEEIGRRMKIEVVANIPREEKITVDLDMMYLEDALKRFKTNHAYIAKTEKRKGNITKIVVVPKGGGKMLPNKFKYDPQPSIHKFEYNPQPSIKKDEVKKEKIPVETEGKAIKEVGTEEPSHPEPLKSEYDLQPSIKTNEVKEEKRPVETESKAIKEVGTEEPSYPEPLKSEYDPQPSILKSEYDPQP